MHAPKAALYAHACAAVARATALCATRVKRIRRTKVAFADAAVKGGVRMHAVRTPKQSVGMQGFKADRALLIIGVGDVS